MALKNQALTVSYTAWDTVNQTGKTADGGNHTLRVIKDGVASAATNTPSEVDSTNAPGEYSLALTAGEMNANFVKVAGKSATAGISIIPVPIVTERGVLPTVAPNAANGFITYGTGTGQLNVATGKAPATLASTDVSGNVATDVQTIKTQTVTCAAAVTVLANVGTAAANTAQSGDAFSRIGVNGAGLTAIGDTRLANLDAAVSSRSTFAGGTVSGVTGAVGSVTGNVGGNVGGSVGSVVAGVTLAAATHTGAIIPRVTLVDTLTTYTGNTPQTGDSFARIGVNGAGLTAVGGASGVDAAISANSSIVAIKAVTDMLAREGTPVTVASGTITNIMIPVSGVPSTLNPVEAFASFVGPTVWGAYLITGYSGGVLLFGGNGETAPPVAPLPGETIQILGRDA
jgi:hypothetical protein